MLHMKDERRYRLEGNADAMTLCDNFCYLFILTQNTAFCKISSFVRSYITLFPYNNWVQFLSSVIPFWNN